MTYIEHDSVLNLLELSHSDGIVGITPMEICNDSHPLLIFVSVDKPSNDVLIR